MYKTTSNWKLLLDSQQNELNTQLNVSFNPKKQKKEQQKSVVKR